MEYIQNLYYMVQDYWILTMLIGLMSCFVESFIPALPLIGIVTGNAMFFGFLNGMILSWIGSGLGTILLFLLTKKFKDSIHMERFKNEKVKKEDEGDLEMGDDDFSDSFHEPSGSSGGDVIDFGDDINIDTGANNTSDLDLGAEEPAAEPAADMLGELPSPENLGVDFTQNTEF